MITNDEFPIPPESRKAATDALLQTGGDVVAAIRAALNAWPGMAIFRPNVYGPRNLTLPLPEKGEG